MSSPIIETQDVVKIYTVSAGAFRERRSLKAINGVSIKVEKGGVLGLVGESGCGKSTLARILLGLEAATSGQVWLDGKSVSQVG